MADEFKVIIFAFVLIGLFGFLVFTAISEQATIYDKDVSGMGISESMQKFNASVTKINQTFQEKWEIFKKGDIISIVFGVVAQGIFDITGSLWDLILIPFTLVADILSNVFGVPTIVIGVIEGLLIFSIILAIWYLIKQ